MRPESVKKPLVYLDSQDFIRLTDDANDDRIGGVRERLFDLRRKGVCEFGFSYLHILEVLNPDSAGYEAEQKKYGQTIFDLTDGAFPYLNDVISGKSYPNDGIWAPLDILNDFKGLISERKIKDSLREAIADGGLLTRDQIKLALSKRNFAKFVREANLEVPSELALLGATNAEFKSLILHPARHRKRFSRLLVDLFSDPRMYSEMVARVSPDENPLLEKMNAHFEKMYVALTSLIEQHSEAMEQRVELLEKAATLKNAAEKSGLIDNGLAALTKKIRQLGSLPSVQSNEALKDPRFHFLDTYLARVVKIEKMPTRSEIRDLLHLMYVPEVDLIRVDRRMFEVLKNDRSLKTKIVRRLEDLPDAIEQLNQ